MVVARLCGIWTITCHYLFSIRFIGLSVMGRHSLKSAVFDLETSGLDGVGSGVILCAVIKPLDGKPQVYRYDKMHLSPGCDKILTRVLIHRLCEYDLLIGHNIERFDWNFIRTRALRWNLSLPSHPFLYDTLKAFKRCGYLTVQNHFGKPTASLDMIVDMYGLDQKKTKIYPREHWQTIWGEGKQRIKAMDNLVDHCEKDVCMTEEIFERLFPVDIHAILKRAN